MKQRVLLFILVISVTSFTFISDTNTQVTFRICVYVYPDDDTHLDERLESFVRRELRALGDVQLVQKDADWFYLIAYSILEHELKNGTNNGRLSIAKVTLLAATSDSDGYDPKDDPLSLVFGRSGYLMGLGPAHWSADNLHEYAIDSVGRFDKGYLETHRKYLVK